MVLNQESKNISRREEVLSQVKTLKNIPRFCRLVWTIAPGLSSINIFLRVIQAVLPVSILYVGKEVIDEVVELSQKGASSELFWSSETLLFWIITGLCIGILFNILTRFTKLSDTLLGDWVNNETSVSLMLQASSLELQYFEDPNFYDSLDLARTHARNRIKLISIILDQIQLFITLTALLTALMVFSPLLLTFLILIVIPTFIAESHFNKKDYKLTQKWTSERREMNYLLLIAMQDQVAKEVKVFGLEKFITNRFRKLATGYYYAKKKIALNRNIIGSLFNVLTTTSYYSAYVFVLHQTVSGVLTIGTMTFLGGAFKRMQGILQSTARNFSQVTEIGLYLQDFFDFLDMSLAKPMDNGQEVKPVPDLEDSEIKFENVSFKYFGSDQYAIKNISFTLQAGERLALVGENGAGKTTLVKLLARLYRPTEGRILWNGVDIQQFDYEEYRSKIGVIFQDFVRFMFTAKENIFVGNITEKSNQALIKDAATKSLADVIINKFNNGYDQMLGKRFKGGIELSGGQWQKIALARAYMRTANLVILDEPTSALDARSEHEVFLRFTELMEGKSAILISHRFSTVRMADKILFLEKGEILEFGTHQALIDENGKYAELFLLQARGYS